MPAHLALLLDFDGTLYVGDLPILAYARHCAEQLPAAGATELIDGVRFFLEGTSIGDRRVDLGAAEDGYQAVEILGRALGLTEGQVDSAYALARDDLAASAFALDQPEGLEELLDELSGVHVMVVTNAHPVGVAEVLSAIGLARFVDELITDAGKPGSMPALLRRTLAVIHGADEPRRLMVVGDRWSSDLADAAGVGATTGLIDRFGRGDGNPTVRASQLSALVPAIRRWADQFGGLGAEHLGGSSTGGADGKL